MPFGKSNSPKLFCSWTDLWFAVRVFRLPFLKVYLVYSVIGSYVDDAFGGALEQKHTQFMIDTLTTVGKHTATFFNTDKTRGHAWSLVILGLLFCSIS